MEVVFLGTGTSQGVPMIACRCRVCTSEDRRDRRTRASVHVVLGGTRVQVDAAPELRLQCLAEDVRAVDVFILTHGHADHVLGMDDLRRFCDVNGGQALPVHGSAAGLERVRQVFPYAVEGPRVGGYPRFDLREFPEVLELPGGVVRATPLPHGAVQTLGLVFEEATTARRVAYFTDCKAVPPAAVELAREADVLVLDGLRPEPHATHLSIPEAIEVAAEIGARETWLTHLTHAVLHAELEPTLPAGVRLAYDGLRLVV